MGCISTLLQPELQWGTPHLCPGSTRDLLHALLKPTMAPCWYRQASYITRAATRAFVYIRAARRSGRDSWWSVGGSALRYGAHGANTCCASCGYVCSGTQSDGDGFASCRVSRLDSPMAAFRDGLPSHRGASGVAHRRRSVCLHVSPALQVATVLPM